MGITNGQNLGTSSSTVYAPHTYLSFTPGAITIKPPLQPVEVWDGVEVHYNDDLALNVVVYDFARNQIFVSFATMERLRKSPAMKAEAQSLARSPGAHTIPEVSDIPTHHVGRMYRRCLSLLNEFAHGEMKHGQVLELREEIATLRGLLDEAEATLDMCATVERINREA